MPEGIDNWMQQVRKGVLELCILSSIGEGERYGYDLVVTLVKESGLDISEGTVYPLLSRLRKQKLVKTHLVESSEGPARKYYRLTVLGKTRLAMMLEYFRTLYTSVENLQEKND